MNMHDGNTVVMVRAVTPDLLCPSVSERAFPGDNKDNDFSLSRRFFSFISLCWCYCCFFIIALRNTKNNPYFLKIRAGRAYVVTIMAWV